MDGLALAERLGISVAETLVAVSTIQLEQGHREYDSRHVAGADVLLDTRPVYSCVQCVSTPRTPQQVVRVHVDIVSCSASSPWLGGSCLLYPTSNVNRV
jgi:hypothetical protein